MKTVRTVNGLAENELNKILPKKTKRVSLSKARRLIGFTREASSVSQVKKCKLMESDFSRCFLKTLSDCEF